jgi:hypothetical protein
VALGLYSADEIGCAGEDVVFVVEGAVEVEEDGGEGGEVEGDYWPGGESRGMGGGV